MNLKLILTGIAACAVLGMTFGCKKQEPAPVPEAPKAAEGVSSKAAEAVEAVKTTTKEVTEKAATQVNVAQDQAQAIIDRAKTFVADKRYQDALSGLSQLGTTKLTPEQQQRVDDLKAQIQAALAKAAVSGSNAASALGGVLGGKK